MPLISGALRDHWHLPILLQDHTGVVDACPEDLREEFVDCGRQHAVEEHALHSVILGVVHPAHHVAGDVVEADH